MSKRKYGEWVNPDEQQKSTRGRPPMKREAKRVRYDNSATRMDIDEIELRLGREASKLSQEPILENGHLKRKDRGPGRQRDNYLLKFHPSPISTVMGICSYTQQLLSQYELKIRECHKFFEDMIKIDRQVSEDVSVLQSCFALAWDLQEKQTLLRYEQEIHNLREEISMLKQEKANWMNGVTTNVLEQEIAPPNQEQWMEDLAGQIEEEKQDTSAEEPNDEMKMTIEDLADLLNS